VIPSLAGPRPSTRCYDRSTRVLTGRVIDGKVDVGDVPDGTGVAVFAPELEPVVLTPPQQAELAEALDEIHRGEFEDGFALLHFAEIASHTSESPSCLAQSAT
jgi:hypothetical protein